MDIDLDALTEELSKDEPYDPITVGKLVSIISTLAERVDCTDDPNFAQDYVDRLEKEGVLIKE